MRQKIIINIEVAKGYEDCIPRYQTPGSSGVDLHAAIEKKIVINPGDIKMIDTGIKVAIPEGYEGQVRPRSGLVLNSGLSVANSPGSLDSDYRSEVKVLLINLGKYPVLIERGMRIAQLVFAPIIEAVWGFDTLEDTERGEGGFGSTGI